MATRSKRSKWSCYHSLCIPITQYSLYSGSHTLSVFPVQWQLQSLCVTPCAVATTLSVFFPVQWQPHSVLFPVQWQPHSLYYSLWSGNHNLSVFPVQWQQHCIIPCEVATTLSLYSMCRGSQKQAINMIKLTLLWSRIGHCVPSARTWVSCLLLVRKIMLQQTCKIPCSFRCGGTVSRGELCGRLCFLQGNLHIYFFRNMNHSTKTRILLC